MNIFDIVTAQNIKAYYEADTNRPPFPGEAWFPRKKQLGLRFSQIKGKQDVPVALVASAQDSKVLFRDFEPLNITEGKLIFFKEAVGMDEELRSQLITLKEDYIVPLLDKIMDPYEQLIVGAEVTMERMRMQLLSQGTISVKENGVDKNTDYGFNAATQFKNESKLWSAEGATPLKSLRTQLKNYKKLTNQKGAVVLMSDTLFDYLADDVDIKNVFASLSTPNPAPTDDEIRAYVEKKLGVTIVVLDQVYKAARNFNGESVRYYPEDRYTILPNSVLGETLYGTTPEELDLLGAQSEALSCEVINTGVTITTWKEVDPVRVNVKVSEVGAPTCPYIDQIYIVKVLA